MADEINIIDLLRKMGNAAKNGGNFANNILNPSFTSNKQLVDKYNKANQVIADRAVQNARQQQINEGMKDIFGNKKKVANTFNKLKQGSTTAKTAPNASKVAQASNISNGSNVYNILQNPKFKSMVGRGLLTGESIGALGRSITKPDEYYNNRYMVDPEFDRGADFIAGLSGLTGAATYGKAGLPGKIAAWTGPAFSRGLQFAKEHPKASMVLDNIWGPAAWQPVQSYIANKNVVNNSVMPGGNTLKELGFNKMPQTEEELAELRKRVAEIASQGKANTIVQPIKNNTTTPQASNTGYDSGEYLDKTGKMINGLTANNGYDKVKLLPKVEVSNEEEQYTPVEDVDLGIDVRPFDNKFTIEDIISNGQQEQPVQQEDTNKNALDVMLERMLNGDYRNTAITPENLALARLAGGYRRNPYYAQLMDRGNNLYRTQAAQMKLAQEYMKQQQADDAAKSTAYWLYSNNFADNLEDAYLMAKANPKLVNPYLGYMGRQYASDSSMNRTKYMQDQMNYRQQQQLASQKALKQMEIDSRLNPQLKADLEIAKIMNGSMDIKTQQQALPYLINKYPKYFSAVGRPDENGPSEDMY